MLPVLISLLIFLYSFTFPFSIFAQSTGDLFATYISAGNSYRTSYSSYLQAKNSHLQYNTGATRQEALSKAVDVLAKRNNWLITYLEYLKQTLADATNIANYAQTTAFFDLETEITALKALQYNLGDLNSFSKVNTASKNWEDRLVKTDKLILATRMQITTARLTELQTGLEKEFHTFQTEIGTPSASMKSTLDLITQKLITSISSRQKIDASLNARAGDISYQSTLTKVHQDLSEASRLLLELKNQNK